jgi:hypothetical protein
VSEEPRSKDFGAQQEKGVRHERCKDLFTWKTKLKMAVLGPSDAS